MASSVPPTNSVSATRQPISVGAGKPTGQTGDELVHARSIGDHEELLHPVRD